MGWFKWSCSVSRHVESCSALCHRVFISPCSTVITSLVEEKIGLCASHAFVCLFCTRWFVLFLFLLAADCDYGNPWTFLLTVCLHLKCNMCLEQTFWFVYFLFTVWTNLAESPVQTVKILWANKEKRNCSKLSAFTMNLTWSMVPLR